MSSTNMPESTEDADSSLQTTIQRLDQAFERIRNLRRDILQEQANRISPGHEAILLTGHEGYQDDLERIRTVIPADTRERLRQFESRGPEADRERDRSRARSHLLRAAAAHMYPLDTSVTPSSSHPSSAQSPLSFASPLSPPRQRLLPHRLLDTVTQPLRRRESSDDPNTELGRRIFGAATRESARDTITHNSSPDGPHRLPTVIERDFEYASRTRLRRSEPAFARRVEISLDQLRQEVENRVSRSLDAVGASASSSAESSARHTNSRSNRTSRSRQSSNPSTNLSSATSTQSRLSLLSNFPVQNFPTPSSTLSNPPLLFEEPTSYVHDERMQSINEEQQRALEDHYPFQVRMGWDGRADQDLLFTSSPVQMHHESEVVRTGYNRDNTIQMPGGSSQFMLDANGDEIRPEDPARAQTMVGSSLGLYSYGPTRRHATDEYFVSATHNAGNRDGPPPPTTHDPGDGAYYFTILPDTTICGTSCTPEPKQRIFGTTVPRYIDPLPSALVDKFSATKPKVQRPVLHISTTRVSDVAGR